MRGGPDPAVVRRFAHDPRVQGLITEAAVEGVRVESDLAIPHPSGENRILAVSASPVDATLGLGRSVVVVRDVTQDRAHTSDLARFAGVVAHDLRTPLAAVDLWTDTLEHELTTRSPGAGNYEFAQIRSATTRMSQFIADLLAHNRARHGGVSPQDLCGRAVLVEVAEHWESQARRPAEITVNGSATVHADPVLVRQVMDNLVENAIKYTPQDRPPRVDLTIMPGRPGWVHLFVDDEGSGLPEGAEKAMFAEFARDPEFADHHPGQGIGLAICATAVRRHGGLIVAHRKEVRTRVEIVLPEDAGTFDAATAARPLVTPQILLAV